MLKSVKIILFLISTLTLFACNKVEEGQYQVDATDEMAQQVGDSMVSVDEFGGTTTGTISQLNSTGYEKSFARLSRGQNVLTKIFNQNISDLFIAKSYAATACNVVPFQCNGAGASSRTFSECTLPGGGALSGSVNLTYTGSGTGTCTIPANGDRVVRAPNYEVRGLRGAIFKVSPLTTGQSLTRASASTFNLNSTGIRRTFTTGEGKVVLDMSSLTTSALTINGSTRGVRSLSNSGGVMIIDNLTSGSCSMTPFNVQWTSGCNCPTSGNWSGSCTDGLALTVAFGGATCGETTITKGSAVKILTMDRCQP